MTKYESEIQYVARPVEAVYARFSDLRNLENLRERLSDPAVQAQISQQVGEDKLAQLSEQMQNVTFTADGIEMSTAIGQMSLSIIEREEPKLLKFALQGAPMEAYVWLQLLPVDENSSRFRVTIGAELNFFIKKMVGSKLEQATQGLAQILAVAALA